MKRFVELLATVGGLGHIRIAPGTFGSLPGLFLGVFIHYLLRHLWNLGHLEFIAVSTLFGLLLSAIAYWSIIKIEGSWRHDDSRIVIDELVGQYFVTVYFPISFFNFIASFALFRLFDIVKPWPIRKVDREWHHAMATLVDDLMASVLGIACLYGISKFWA